MFNRSDPCDNCGVLHGDCMNSCYEINKMRDDYKEQLEEYAKIIRTIEEERIILKEEIKELNNEIEMKDLKIFELDNKITHLEYEMF